MRKDIREEELEAGICPSEPAMTNPCYFLCLAQLQESQGTRMLCLHAKGTMLKAEFRIKVRVGSTWPGLSAVAVTFVSDVLLGFAQAFGCLVCC